MIQRRGGNCPNTLEVLQQLLEANKRSSVSLALSVILPSSSSAGTQQIKSSLRPMIDLSPCIHREGSDQPASCYVIRSRSTDSRTIVNYNGLSDMTSEEFVAIANKLKDNLTWCHFEASGSIFATLQNSTIDKRQGRVPEVALECMRYLRQNFPAVTLSVEVENPTRVGLPELAKEANVVFYSKNWAQVGCPGLNSPLRTDAECFPGLGNWEQDT